MTVSELLPILENLSEAEKIRILEFLKADLDRAASRNENRAKHSPTPSDSMPTRLQRKENLLVIETGSLAHIDFNQLIEQLREDPHPL
jgi:hypothetical protein